MGIVSMRSIFIDSADGEQLVRVRPIRQELAAVFGDDEHVFVLHSESSRDVDQRLDSNDHPLPERLVAVAAEIGLFVEREADPVADEAERLEAASAEAPPQFSGTLFVR